MPARQASPRPSQFPPDFDPVAEVIKRGLDPSEEVIDVGVVIVGGGTAGLAAANRLTQLLADDPRLAEALGEVPVAVIEKARSCGGHTMSGAVMVPGPLEELYPELTRQQWRAEGFAFGEVRRDGAYLMPNSRRAVKLPRTPPNFENVGNEVISVAALGRFQQRRAEAGGAEILTETAATRLIVQDGRVVGVRSGDRGRGADGRELANFEPGSDIRARVTVLAEGGWGHLSGAAIREFDLGAHREPAVWELGVKEVWRVPKALDRVIHTLGPWPLNPKRRYGQVGGAWLYPMRDAASGDDLVSIGLVVGLEYRDATTSAHDLLQLLKTHPMVRAILAGGERVAWSAKTLPAGGFWSMPRPVMPGALLVGDAGGLVDTVALKGVHHAIRSGRLAAEAIHRSLVGEAPLARYETLLAESATGRDLWAARNARQPLARGLLRGAPSTALAVASRGLWPRGRLGWRRNDEAEMFVGDSSERYPAADGRYIFDKLSSVYASHNATRENAPDHIRVARRVPREIALTWAWMCPAGVYEVAEPEPGAEVGPESEAGSDAGEGTDGLVDVLITPSNCVQCGAITAKGGRLTPPEGGDGPHYTIV